MAFQSRAGPFITYYHSMLRRTDSKRLADVSLMFDIVLVCRRPPITTYYHSTPAGWPPITTQFVLFFFVHILTSNIFLRYYLTLVWFAGNEGSVRPAPPMRVQIFIPNFGASQSFSRRITRSCVPLMVAHIGHT
jgi:hypothetical protein